MDKINFSVIGHLRSKIEDKYEASIQPNLIHNSNICYVELVGDTSLFQAIKYLENFERIWLIYQFSKSLNWKPMVLPPRYNKKIGVLATRSPHRPSPIGISVCKLIKVNGKKIYIENNDILDGSPIIDIKPYIPEHDSFPDSRIGWNQMNITHNYEFSMSKNLMNKITMLDNDIFINYLETIKQTLTYREWGNKNTRIKQLSDLEYQIRIKSWTFTFHKEEDQIIFSDLLSSYNKLDITFDNKGKIHEYELHCKYYQLFIS